MYQQPPLPAPTFAPPPAVLSPAKEKQLPNWLSIPVLVAGFITTIGLIVLLVVAPVSILGFIPIVMLAPVFWWGGNLKPSYKPTYVHSFLWGATVSILIAFAINTTTGLILFDSANTTTYFSELAVAIGTAPIFEELLKGGAVLYAAIKLRQIDSKLDAIVVASFSALGFTVIEDVYYIATPYLSNETAPLETALDIAFVRIVMSFFIHTLFTFWIGFAVGRAIEQRKSLASSWWGWVVAIILHAIWNGTVILGEVGLQTTGSLAELGGFILLLVGGGAVTLIIYYISTINSERRKAILNLNYGLGWLTHSYAVPTKPVNVFFSWESMRYARKAQSKQTKESFDRVTTSLVRLSQLHEEEGRLGLNPSDLRPDEAELIAELNKALNRPTLPIAPASVQTTPNYTPTAPVIPPPLVASREISHPEHSFDLHAMQGTGPQSDQISSPPPAPQQLWATEHEQH